MVFEVNADRQYAKVRPCNVDYVTANRDYTNVDPTKTLETWGLGLDGKGEASKGAAIKLKGSGSGFVYYGEMTGGRTLQLEESNLGIG